MALLSEDELLFLNEFNIGMKIIYRKVMRTNWVYVSLPVKTAFLFLYPFCDIIVQI